MKHFLTLAICMLIACCSSSQTLRPKIRIEQSDTLFCFSIGQAKTIAKHIAAGAYCDSLQQLCNDQQVVTEALLSNRDSVIELQQHQLANLKITITDYKISADLQHQMLLNKDKTIRHTRRIQKMLSAGLIILSGVCLYQYISH